LKYGIGCNQNKFLFKALSNEHAVEWVPMMKVQALDPQNMVQCNRENLHPICS